MNNNEKAKCAVKALDSKKALDIEIIDIAKLSILGDYLIIATGTSTTHINALSDEVEFELEKLGVRPGHIEGRGTQWVLLDYGDIMIHVFLKEARNFYALERLWADGKPLDVNNFI